MARLPNSDRLILDLRKLEDYCLNPTHPRGRHKARVFRDALGLTRTDARWLCDALLDAARHADPITLESDSVGQRWRIDVALARHERRAVVRTIWILRPDESVPRFVTCWVL